jgi:uncharacterized protein (TIGR02996 family)
MDAEERALIAAIIAQPEEDTPRLAYADWLQEHGQEERAELIRTQVELARGTVGTLSAAERNERDARVRELLRRHSKQWRKPLLRTTRTATVNWGPFERGMVDSAAVSVWGWTSEVSHQLAGLLGRTAQHTLRVRLHSHRGHDAAECAEMLAWGGLQQFERVCLVGFNHLAHDAHPPRAFFTPFWAHRWGARPRTLDLSGCGVTDEAVAPMLDRDDAELPAIIVLPHSSLGGMMSAFLRLRFGERIRFV